ncbi:NAD(P)H dehydrogenase (quinone) [Acidocella aminolytica 101 = DSM 11237]|nr:NAD(P)H dehydrogenase (quinone) [Acidocella aminolytica 101 = DSM 11237]
MGDPPNPPIPIDRKRSEAMIYAVTGATGHLGRHVIAALLETLPASCIAALVRTPSKADDMAKKGVSIREAEYDKPETLLPALAGVDKLLLVASSKLGGRVAQHKAVIDAAKQANVRLIAYTSVLRADTSELAVAEEHRQTEALLGASGIPFVLLRNGWYTENYTFALPSVLQHGVVLGSAGEGRIASAARDDYAEAAAAVLTAKENQARIYELAGDVPFTMAELAAEISRQSGKRVVYRDMPEADYRASLVNAGLPECNAASFARSSAASRHGALFDDGHQLSSLIGRPTTSLHDVVSRALGGLGQRNDA